MGVEATGKTLGLIGAGQHRLDRRGARQPRDEGRRIRSVPDPRTRGGNGREKVDLDQLLARADFITLHTP
ncbi:hypothetical protein [Novosphingobium sp.]|uniref:hypothetical protein n=1 Tax=Novosphingobium sp. TaxID=1874826 RepID=UPI0025FAD0AF|nr:hypothetical protein [Novosphingobium sp.]